MAMNQNPIKKKTLLPRKTNIPIPLMRANKNKARIKTLPWLIKRRKSRVLEKLQGVLENVSISFAIPKRSTKKLDQRCRQVNIVSCARIVTKTMLTILSVNFVSKFTRTMMQIKKISINGSAVINVSDGYSLF